MPITTELFLRMLTNTKEEKIADRKRYSRLADLAQIHMALGGEEVCELLERRLHNCLETEERTRQDQEQKHRARLLRSRQRELVKAPVERVA
jgi:hypothetical protein